MVGLLDDDQKAVGTHLGGVTICGTLADAPTVAQSCGASDVLVLANSLPGKRLRKLMDACKAAGVGVKIISNVYDLMGNWTQPGKSGKAVLQMRDVDIADLLRRKPVELDGDALGHLLTNRVVLITGAGGSIGSEICRQVMRFAPETIVLVERAENSLFHIDRELRGLYPTARILPILADITDEARLRRVFENCQPAVIFHAAAHKHVPMMEYNPCEAITNNVQGTRLLADLADEFGVQSFVLISTDKAVNPSSIMGLSKNIAERYVHALSQHSTTRFVAVRFGNVLGSAGSVVPIFQDQIRGGGPVTITDPEMRRYFMTIPEASQLVLQAGAMGKGGEIYELEMGEPVRIVDLAEDLIRLSGLKLDDVEIVFTGMRPGEKLFEELYFDEEKTLPTPHPKMRVAGSRPHALDEVSRLIERLAELATLSDPAELHQRLWAQFPEYRASSRRPDFVPAPASVSNPEPTPEPALSAVSGGGHS